MSVKEYYIQHFSELSPDNQFHFATRIKNYFKSNEFQDFFAHYQPSRDLGAIFEDNDYSRVNKAAIRKPYFEKYPQLYAIEAMLFRVNHLLNEYGIDLRSEFLQLVSLEELYRLVDSLMADDGAIAILSTWAVNTICLAEVLFPRGHNVVAELAKKALQIDPEKSDPLLLVYLYTHIILCDSVFYTRPVTEKALARKMLAKAAKIIEQNFDSLSLDVRIEFLVCADMVGVSYPVLRKRIAEECRQILAQNDFIVDPRRPKFRQALNGAEHANVLFIMSGLDAELAEDKIF